MRLSEPTGSVAVMLTQVAPGVSIHTSDFIETNTIVVQGPSGVLLVDPGIHGHELACLVKDLAGESVVAAFSTHPHWDHLVWHPELGTPPRYATALAADTARARLANGIDTKRFGIPDDVPLEFLGDIEGLPGGATTIPWDGPTVRVLEHKAHAPGHAALLVEGARVLIAGDMLSDVLLPMLDLMGAADPIQDYLDSLELFESVASEVDVVIPGHGSVTSDLQSRIDQDRAYIESLRDGREPVDSRIDSPRVGYEFVRDAHAGQAQRLAADRG